MRDNTYQEVVEEVIEKNSVLALSTTDGTMPWVAPLEYLHDDAGNLYFGCYTGSDAPSGLLIGNVLK